MIRGSVAYLLKKHPRPPWIAAGSGADRERWKLLEAAGARIIPVLPGGDGRLDLALILRELRAAGIKSVMVEGGGQIISSFISRKLVDHLVVTVSPVFVGGIQAFKRERSGGVVFPRLKNIASRWLGKDMILEGEVA
ncbi:MAG: RibD family protein [Endomicrobiales bacterium]